VQGLADIWNKLGVVHAHLKQDREAEAAYREAMRVAREFTGRFPSLPSGRKELAYCCHNLAIWLTIHDRNAEALTLHEEATAILERLAAEFPVVSQHAEDLGLHYLTRGSQLQKMSSSHAALGYADKAVKVLAAGFKADSRLGGMRNGLLRAHVLRSVCLVKLGRPDEALRACDLAASVDAAAAQDAEVREARFWASWAVRQQLVTELRLAKDGRHAEAASLTIHKVEGPLFASLLPLASINGLGAACELAAANDLAARGPVLGITCYNATCVFTRCAAAAEKQKDPALADVYTRWAMRLLTRARDDGYFATDEGRKLLESDSDLNRLRGREDFQRLREGLKLKPETWHEDTKGWYVQPFCLGTTTPG
jgi:tetratricopeptide (TPR) repeat protein